MPSKKNLGLVLTLGGAPNTPHMIPGLPGLYHPERPVPVGGPGEPTEEQAREAAKADGVPVELREFSEKELDQARAAIQEDIRASQNGQRELRRDPASEEEAIQHNNERAATDAAAKE